MVAALIILQAAILGVLIGGGFWLRHVVNQQLRLKDGEIRALKAEKERLEPLTGAEFVERERRLTEYAKRAAKQSEDYEKKIEALLLEKAGAVHSVDRMEKHASDRYLDGLAKGALEGWASLRNLSVELVNWGMFLPGYAQFYRAFEKCSEKREDMLSAFVDSAIKRRKPEFPNSLEMERRIEKRRKEPAIQQPQND